MPLAPFLSAVRELILDDGPPEGDAAVRLAALSARFGGLTERELDDLAAITPKRFAFYRRLIFSGERGLLQWAFPITLAVIDRIRASLGDDRSQRDAQMALVVDLHRYRAWESHSTRRLATNFKDFVRDKRGEWTAHWPGLIDLIEFERIEQEVFYAEDSPHAPIDADRLTKLSVDELMAMKVARPADAIIAEFDVDLIGMARAWHRDKKLPDQLPQPEPTRAVCYRDPDSLMPRWLTLTDAGWAGLSAAKQGECVTVGAIASAYVAEPAVQELCEHEQFQRFFASLSRWATLRMLRAGDRFLTPL